MSEKYRDLVVQQISKQAPTTTRTDSNPKAGGILDHVLPLMAQRNQTRIDLEAALALFLGTELAASLALSLIPFESNFGSYFGGISLYRLASPLINGVYVEPTMESIRHAIPTRHLSPRIYAQGLALGAFTDDQVAQYAVYSGLMDDDVNALIQLAQIQRFNNNVKEDLALIDKYETAQLTAQINDRKDDLKALLADKKAALKAAQAELAALTAGASP
jgi:hypothetical protein